MLRLFILDQQFAVLTVPSRLIQRYFDHIESTPKSMHILEDFYNSNEYKSAYVSPYDHLVSQHGLNSGLLTVHLFKRSTSSFWIEEVNTRDDGCVDNSEHGVGVVPDPIEGNWCDHDDHKVEDPVRSS